MGRRSTTAARRRPSPSASTTGTSRASSAAGCGTRRTTPGDLRTSSSVFDFTTQFTLKDNKDRYLVWYGFGHGLGLMGDTTDGQPWKQRAVTFLENHDTGYRTNAGRHSAEGPQVRQLPEHMGSRAGVRLHPHASRRAVRLLEALLRLGPGPAEQDPRARQRAEGGGRSLGQRSRPSGQRAVAGRLRGAGDRPRRRSLRARRRLGRGLATLGLRVCRLPRVPRPAPAGASGCASRATPRIQQAPRKPALPVPAYRPPESIAIPDEWLNP